MTNNTNGINIDIRINGEKLDEFRLRGRSCHRSRFQAWITVQNCTDNSSTSETEDHMEQPTYLSKLKDQTYALPGYLGTVVRLGNMDIDSGHPEVIAGHWDEMPQETAWHLIQKPHH